MTEDDMAHFEILTEPDINGPRTRWRLRDREGRIVAKSKNKFLTREAAKLEADRFARQCQKAIVVDMTGTTFLDEIQNMQRVVKAAMERVMKEYGPTTPEDLVDALAKELGADLLAAIGTCSAYDDGKHRCMGCGEGMVLRDD